MPTKTGNASSHTSMQQSQNKRITFFKQLHDIAPTMVCEYSIIIGQMVLPGTPPDAKLCPQIHVTPVV